MTPHGEGIPTRHTMMLRSPYRYLKEQAMASIDVLIKHHNLVMVCDTTEHILPNYLAKEGLINYSIVFIS